MDFLGTWGKRTQDLLGGPSVASRMKGLDQAQRAAIKRGGVRDLLNDPDVTARAADVASNFNFTGSIASHVMPKAYGRPGAVTEILEEPTSRELLDLAKGDFYTSSPTVRVILGKEGKAKYAWPSSDAIHDEVREHLKLPRQSTNQAFNQNDIIGELKNGRLMYRNLNLLDPAPPMPLRDYVRHMGGEDLPLFNRGHR
jgi:hypothetical protein